jgi:hypothetical protein
MRQYVLLHKPVRIVKKIMIYGSKDGVYVFLYDTVDDRPCYADLWYELFEDAIEHCEAEYNVKNDDWIIIDEPKQGGQHDIIC